MSTAPSPPAIALAGISKRFGAVAANRDVTLAVAAGSIHGIVGENGAGKSTLMSILYGFYEADAGEIRIKGQPRRIRSPADAIANGIGMVHQHFMLVETLSVAETVMLGAEGGALLKGGLAKARAELTRLSREYGLAIDPDALVGDLSVGLQQRVEILKALYRGAEILILDEPTAVLTPAEADQLFALLRALKAQGRTVILITHKLREIMAVTDTVSVMRRGEMVGHFVTATTSPPALAEAMVGRHVLLRVEKPPRERGAPVLEAVGLSCRDARGSETLREVSLTLHAGEIVGIAGVAGNGQSELLEVLAGLLQPTRGVIRLDGKILATADRHPARLRARGLMHIPEDRQRSGLVTAFSAAENAILGYQRDPAFGTGPLMSPQRIAAHARAAFAAYDVRPPDPALSTAAFSGGNQQKIVLAREIERHPRVLLVGQPTRGVDIGAIEFIHRRLLALRDAGVAILLVSVELEEVMALSDRILAMCGGRITGERRADAADERDLGLLMAGVAEEAA
ncbi:ABC transporter ATP-binding protein [Bosea minatitlanensis]|uniref:ABC transporter ATP-binding protein n=1 Tax=Bosea minatitlanensis TaxID=128782 RepID=A0ABW0F7D7_9HYPH|nr:ABC transporter ATP-binding protein [Bosea minatitlanensis]MCT4494251.1 ABC transporter ATP-binding protein [Bosea minatitlanensis]